MRIDQESMQTFRIGDCPACRYPVWAEVDLAVKVGVPYLEADGKARAYIDVLKRGCRIHHECRDEDDGFTPSTAPLSDAGAVRGSQGHGGAGRGSEGEGAA